MKILKMNERIFLILLFFVLAGIVFNFIPFDGGDNLKYFFLSRSIQQGEYKSVWLPRNPLHAHYPPLFPILLSICPNYLCCKFLIFGMFLLTIFFSYQLFQELKLPKYTILLFAFSPLLIKYSHLVLSEIPFLLFSILALLYFYRKKWGFAFLFGLCAYFTRSIGLGLMVALTIGYYNEKT
jgi:hypothetical protein